MLTRRRNQFAKSSSIRYHSPTIKHKLRIIFATCLAYCIDKELYKAIDYLKTQVEVLKELQHEQESKRILLNDNQRRRLARKARALSRKLLEETTVLFTPETVLGWYRKLIANKYGGTKTRSKIGRPNIHKQIVELVIQIRQENPQWGTQRMCDTINSLDLEVARTTVRNILINHGYDPEPSRKPTWKQFIKTHFNVIAAVDFFSVDVFTPKGLIRHMVLFAIDLHTRRVEILGIKCDPNGLWMQ